MQPRSEAVPTAQIFTFPPARHRRIVAFIAAEMRKQPSAEAAEDYLISHLNVEWRRLSYLGIGEDEAEMLCRSFALATWREVYRDQPAKWDVA